MGFFKRIFGRRTGRRSLVGAWWSNKIYKLSGGLIGQDTKQVLDERLTELGESLRNELNL